MGSDQNEDDSETASFVTGAERVRTPKEKGIRDYLADPVIARNLGCSVVLWLACAFGYYLINFEIKYMPGNLYVNVLMSTSAEVLAKAAAYTQQSRLGLKKSYYAGLSVALLGCMLLLVSNGRFESRLILGLCLFVAKFGIAFTFMINYLSIVKLFPTLFCGTAAGICNFGGRLATIFAPLAAEFAPPTPVLILGSLLLAASTSSTLLII